MAHAWQPQEQQSAFVERDEVVLVDFRETDPEVVKVVVASDDAEGAVHRCLQVGARAIHLAQVKMDSKLVEDEFSKLELRFRSGIEEGLRSIKVTSDRLLDPASGELPRSLEGWKEDVRILLEAPFNEDSKSSIVAKFETLLERAREDQIKGLKQVLNPEDPDMPLGRWKREVAQLVNERAESLLKGFADLAEKVAVDRAVTDMIEKTSGKGFSFEEIGHQAVSDIACTFGDVAEAVGKVAGVSGNQLGDEVVAVNPEDGRGQFVVEFKDRKLGVKAILDELEGAMENREAPAAVAVFSRATNSPVKVPFQIFGNKAIVTLDKEIVDDGALRLACMWARWMVIRQHLGEESGPNVERIASLIEEGARSLTRVSNIRRAHSMARRKIDEAGNQANEMAQELVDMFASLRDEIEQI